MTPVPLAVVAAVHRAPGRAFSWHAVAAPGVAACPAPHGVADTKVLDQDLREALVDEVMVGRCLMRNVGRGREYLTNCVHAFLLSFRLYAAIL
jgi:hypothetical protein